MINHAPEPRLEPDHQNDYDYDESDIDFLQTTFNFDEPELIPFDEDEEIKALVRSEPQCPTA